MFPPSESDASNLEMLLQEPVYSRRKKLFTERRAAFKADPKAIADLTAYEKADESYEYTSLRGLVPAKLIGDAAAGGGVPYGKADTFFTDFLQHHTEDFVLSSSDTSFVIGNMACHDVRLYSAEWDPSGEDKSASAGMTFFHFLVIPRRRIYNAVCLEDTSILEEMIDHFTNFWRSSTAYQQCIDRLQKAIDQQAETIRTHLRQEQMTAPSRLTAFDSVMKDVQNFINDCSPKLRSLTPEDFVFAVHPAPDASIGHLHMHVLAVPIEFRRWSTQVHDWKTISVKAVVEVINDEAKAAAAG